MEHGRRKGRILPLQQFRFCHVYCLSRVRRFVSSFPQSTTFFAVSLLSTSCHVQKRRISARETEPARKTPLLPQLFFKPFPSRKRTGEKEGKNPPPPPTRFKESPEASARERQFSHTVQIFYCLSSLLLRWQLSRTQDESPFLGCRIFPIKIRLPRKGRGVGPLTKVSYNYRMERSGK